MNPIAWPLRPWRVGRKLGRTLYERRHLDGPSDDDSFLGIMDSREDAERVVRAVNADRANRMSAIAEARATILAEIDDMDPDRHMRDLMDDDTREGDPGHAGNAWWRAYIETAGMCRALAAIDGIANEQPQETPWRQTDERR